MSLSPAAPGATPPASQIRISPPQLSTYSYPAGQPPVRIKDLGGKEAGLCDSEVSCELRIGVEFQRFTLRSPVATVTSVDFLIGAKITLWLQEDSPPEILRHEETHRAISEHYYEMAYTVARRLSDKTLGQKLPLTGKPKEDAAKKAVTALEPVILAEFERQISSRIKFAQERFDAITDHSRKDVPNEAAMAQAISDEAAHWNAQPEPPLIAPTP